MSYQNKRKFFSENLNEVVYLVVSEKWHDFFGWSRAWLTC